VATTPIEPTANQVLEFCSRDPVERVFLEDAARRGYGRFLATADEGDSLLSLCHLGANLVPSGNGCGAYADAARTSEAKMIIGSERAVGELWDDAGAFMPAPRADRPRQPVYTIVEPPEPGETALHAATLEELELLIPVCAAAHELELGVDPMSRDPEAFRWRTRSQIVDGRSWLWVDRGRILFKAEASAWTPRVVQLQQVWVDPAFRGRGYGARGMRDLCRQLLASTPIVTLFVRSENAPAIATYESIGMQRVGFYRSLLF
jgi:ribosomal protein S18 acetylase RimI-like enzyme